MVVLSLAEIQQEQKSSSTTGWHWPVKKLESDLKEIQTCALESEDKKRLEKRLLDRTREISNHYRESLITHEENIEEVFNYTKTELDKVKKLNPIELIIAINEFFDFNYDYVYKKVLTPKMK